MNLQCKVGRNKEKEVDEQTKKQDNIEKSKVLFKKEIRIKKKGFI